ncbi:MAG: FAD-dependent oxidoreductase [Candidatus Omnitrophica bacterium]|nr:FAD-dependent oxidoreductase [Candidatus Omnitrophota bacterium]
MAKEQLAIIGSGISGMAAAYFLRDKYSITFFEKNNYFGGHTNTLTVDDEGEEIFIDSAFMVYNEMTYPLLTKLFKQLGVVTKATDMSFSVQHLPSKLEYTGTGFNGLFIQRRNLVNPRHYRMLMDIHRFNQESVEVLNKEEYQSYTIEQYIKERRYGQDMLHKYLVPMSSAVWSTPPSMMLRFPILTLVRFFKNHGFLGLTTHYQWRTVEGGSRQYRDQIVSTIKPKIHLNTPIEKIFREKDKVRVVDHRGHRTVFDKVILAAHADESFYMLGDPTDLERNLLARFRYHPNKATLHRDAAVMPRRKGAWSSWNYRIKENDQGEAQPSTIYHMNSLQQVSQKNNYFISINDDNDADPNKIIWETTYTHPLYNVEAMRAQQDLPGLNQQNNNTYFCGAYFRYGFHEDGLMSGMNVAQAISGEEIWS